MASVFFYGPVAGAVDVLFGTLKGRSVPRKDGPGASS